MADMYSIKFLNLHYLVQENVSKTTMILPNSSISILCESLLAFNACNLSPVLSEMSCM